MVIRLQRLPAVLATTGESRSTHYANVAAGLWTRGVKIGPRSTAWPEHETQAILGARLAGKSVEQIRELVRKLHALRQDHDQETGRG